MESGIKVLPVAAVVTVVLVFLAGVHAYAQRPNVPSPTFPVPNPITPTQCLHSSNERPEHFARRSRALGAIQAMAGLQRRQLEATGRFLDSDSLTKQPDVAAFIMANRDWQVEVVATLDSYAVLVKDVLDACQFAYFTGRDGRIYEGTPTG